MKYIYRAFLKAHYLCMIYRSSKDSQKASAAATNLIYEKTFYLHKNVSKTQLCKCINRNLRVFKLVGSLLKIQRPFSYKARIPLSVFRSILNLSKALQRDRCALQLQNLDFFLVFCLFSVQWSSTFSEF